MLDLRWNLVAVVLVCLACQAGPPRIPWAEALDVPPPDAHAHVRLLNASYARGRTPVLVRQVSAPTRAALDYAAYQGSFLLTTEPPAELPPPRPAEAADTALPFGGLVDRSSLTADMKRTPLSPSERAAPLAFEPLTQFLVSQHVGGATGLEVLADAVHGEAWGGHALPGQPAQRISEAYIHDGPAALELWVKIEIAPWYRGLGDLPDPDRDGYPEVYGRVRADHAKLELLQTINAEYATRVLSPEEISIWARQLAASWQRPFHAELLKPGPTWPDARTEPEISGELAGLTVQEPAVVLRAQARGRTAYTVIVVKGAASAAAAGLAPDVQLGASGSP
jgi:hypothetical protein